MNVSLSDTWSDAMIVEVKQWGNSKAFRLPKDFTHAMNLEVGDFLDVEKIDAQTIKLVIVPKTAKNKKRLSLSERVAMTSDDKLFVDEEWDTLSLAGQEI